MNFLDKTDQENKRTVKKTTGKKKDHKIALEDDRGLPQVRDVTNLSSILAKAQEPPAKRMRTEVTETKLDCSDKVKFVYLQRPKCIMSKCRGCCICNRFKLTNY